MAIDYAEWFADARAELHRIQGHKADLLGQLGEIDKQIAALVRTVNALAPLVGEEPENPPEPTSSGITDRIRSILNETVEPLTPTQIRSLLEDAGCDLKSYSNPLSTIHTVLRRLADGLEIKELPLTMDGKKYRCFVGVAGFKTRGKAVGEDLNQKRETSE